MTEIKSTLELAMEKTKKMAISPEERKEIKRKETLQKTTSLFHRSMEGSLTFNDLMKEIERMDEKTGTVVKETLLAQWIDALSLEDPNDRLFKWIESLKGRGVEEAQQKLSHLVSQYQSAKEKAEQRVSSQKIESLKKEGIYGSAVDPDIERSREWKEPFEAIKKSFLKKIETIKQIIRDL